METGGTAPHSLVHLFEARDKPWTWGQTISVTGFVIFLTVFKDASATESIALVVIIFLGVMEERFEIPNELMTMAELVTQAITDQLFALQVGPMLR